MSIGVVLRIFTSISILCFSALKFPSSIIICSSFFCIIALGSGQLLLYRLGSELELGLVLVLVLPYSVEVNILNVSRASLVYEIIVRFLRDFYESILVGKFPSLKISEKCASHRSQITDKVLSFIPPYSA